MTPEDMIAARDLASVARTAATMLRFEARIWRERQEPQKAEPLEGMAALVESRAGHFLDPVTPTEGET